MLRLSQKRNFKRPTGTGLYQDNTFRPVNSPLAHYLKTKFSLEFAHRLVEEVAFAWELSVSQEMLMTVNEITSENVNG